MPGKLRPDLIAGLYAAALEDDVLARVSRIVREVMDVDSTSMYLMADGELRAFEGTPDLVESRDEYLAYYYELDPWKAGRHALLDRSYIGTEIISDRDLLATEFYNDFSVRFGVRRPIGINLQLVPGLIASFGVNRIASKRFMTDEDKADIDELGFHVRAALRLHHRHVRDRDDTAAHHATFDALQFGIVICAQDGRALYANRAALDLDAQGAGLRIGRGAVVEAASVNETDALARIIRRASDGTPGALRLRASRGVLAILARPLDGDDPFRSKRRTVLLSLRWLGAALEIDPALLRELFALSPNQAALCFQLASGHTFEEAAAERGMAIATARAHFREVLVKTGTRNLRDLLKLLASLPQVRP